MKQDELWDVWQPEGGLRSEAALLTGRITRYLSSQCPPAHTHILVPRGQLGIGRNRVGEKSSS